MAHVVFISNLLRKSIPSLKQSISMELINLVSTFMHFSLLGTYANYIEMLQEHLCRIFVEY